MSVRVHSSSDDDDDAITECIIYARLVFLLRTMSAMSSQGRRAEERGCTPYSRQSRVEHRPT